MIDDIDKWYKALGGDTCFDKNLSQFVQKMCWRQAVLAAILVAFVAAKHVELPAPYKDHCILDDKQNLYDPSKQFDIPW